MRRFHAVSIIMSCQPQGGRGDLEVSSAREPHKSLPGSQFASRAVVLPAVLGAAGETPCLGSRHNPSSLHLVFKEELVDISHGFLSPGSASALFVVFCQCIASQNFASRSNPAYSNCWRWGLHRADFSLHRITLVPK